MTSLFKRLFEKPIFLLLAVNIIAGLFLFRGYGLSWDEPLFYDYGNALGYAYSPQQWLSGSFDVDNSYGASGDDHKTRGPAYLSMVRAVQGGFVQPEDPSLAEGGMPRDILWVGVWK